MNMSPDVPGVKQLVMLDVYKRQTKKVARCFYALSQARADSKRYPAIDTLESYSKYLEYPEFIEYARKNISDRWIEDVNEARNMLVRGRETAEDVYKRQALS